MKLSEIKKMKKHAVAFITLFFVSLGLGIIVLGIFLGNTESYIDTDGHTQLAFTSDAAHALFRLTMFLIYGVGIASFIMQVFLLVDASRLNDTLLLVLLAIGFLIGITAIVAAFMLNSKIKKILNQVRYALEQAHQKTVTIDPEDVHEVNDQE